MAQSNPLWLENLQDERDGAALYAGLAAVERDAARAASFRRLAEGERRHADVWARKLVQSGATLPPDRPGTRVRVLLWLARRYGTEAVLPFVQRAESGDAAKYLRQGGEATSLAAEEEEHRGTLAALSGASNARASIARRERGHRGGRAGSLRAAVFGMNDGLVSNLSLVLGVAGAGAAENTIVLTGVAGMLAGACSMAAGEYTSVASQRDLLSRQVELERREIAEVPAEEAAELATILQQKGLSAEHARDAASEIMKDPRQALDTLVREELGLDPEDLGSPLSAAASSFVMFAIGALIPLAPFLATRGPVALLVSLGLGAGVLAGVGALLGLLAGTSPWKSGGRMLALGALAAGITYGLGRVFGATLG
jgi:VIT1/CCC1 family predicted Fe2+/Mn2+ transporter